MDGAIAVGGRRQPIELALAADSTVRTLVEAASRALRSRDCSDLTAPSRWEGSWQWPHRRRPARRGMIGLDTMNCAGVAEFLVRQYNGCHPGAVVLGSPHGSAIHLAIALRAAWLPTGFDVRIPVMAQPAAPPDYPAIAARVAADTPGVTVRPVFDSQRCGNFVHLDVRWYALPAAYQQFLSSRQSPPPAILILQDELEADLVAQAQRWADRTGALFAAAAYGTAPALSALVADLHRAILRRSGKTGNRLVIECGRLLDPYHVRRAGLVPYWCENARQDAVDAAEWWLAGSSPFTSIDVIPEYASGNRSEIAALSQWRALADFGTRQRYVDRRAARAYTTRPLPPRAAAAVLRRHPYDLPPPEPLDVPAAVEVLRLLSAPR